MLWEYVAYVYRQSYLTRPANISITELVIRNPFVVICGKQSSPATLRTNITQHNYANRISETCVYFSNWWILMGYIKMLFGTFTETNARHRCD